MLKYVIGFFMLLIILAYFSGYSSGQAKQEQDILEEQAEAEIQIERESE